MEEWKKYKIGDLCSISSSKRIFAKEYQSSGVPFFRGKEIIEKQKGESISTELYISRSRYDEIKIKYGVPKEGDMLLTSVGTLGIPYIVKNEIFYFKDGNLTWFSDFKGLNSKFLYYWFLSPIAKNAIEAKAIGSTQKALTIDSLSKFEINIPDIDTQNRIASVLSFIDDKIELNRRINDNLEQQAQALFKSWFVDFEPFKEGKFVDSELGMIPESWRVCSAETIFKINIGKTPPRKEQQWFTNINNGNVKWISISDLGSNEIFIEDSKEYLTKEAISKFNIIVVPEDTILVSFKLTVGRVGISNCELTTNEAVARFYLPKSYFREYTYLSLKNYNYARLGSTSSIATAVNSKIIKNMKLLIPPVTIISEFSKRINPLFNAIRIYENEIRNLSKIRNTLLPKLMSGELKINDINN
ncbi:Type I restriction modification DNA specificity domain protein [uncultured Prevotella sp.]|uniref:restriction endonuclease subunit S n=1 Tax=uncultured Prevotella sp. TaxID=159272 RepID=UPI001A4163A8|nr:restriction endonuclease subunit S [uncultured Prevotella sp.]VTY06678.1 Type I restriction modification DNA specificity domain protein [uncultured Prevotella sp.]